MNKGGEMKLSIDLDDMKDYFEKSIHNYIYEKYGMFVRNVESVNISVAAGNANLIINVGPDKELEDEK